MTAKDIIRAVTPNFLRRSYRSLRRKRLIRGENANNVLARIHLPKVEAANDSIIIRTEPLHADTVIAEDGLPLPPAELSMGYLLDASLYISRGKQWARILEDLARDYGSLGPGERILDWGCSSGRVLRHFHAAAAANQLECWGVDLEAEAVRWARDNLAPIQFSTCTMIPSLPFPDGYFSFVYGLSVMTHMYHLEDMWLLELRRILRDGGVLMLTICDESSVKDYAAHGKPFWIPSELNLEDILGSSERCVIRGVDPKDTFTFFRESYIRRVWGRYLDVKAIIPLWAPGSQQSAVVMVK